MRNMVALIVMLLSGLAIADDVVIPDETDFVALTTGSGDCWTPTTVLWAKCGTPPQSCAWHMGTPVLDNPKILYVNGDYFLIPQWTYECPETGGGVTNISPPPNTLCIKKASSGKTDRVFRTLICWTATGCDADAVAANTSMTTQGVKKKKWKFSSDPDMRETPIDEGNLGSNYWEEINEFVYPKYSNCKGDSSHPVMNYPGAQVPDNCNNTNCPTSGG